MKTLNPPELWHYFEAICAIPHPSHHEEKIVNFLKEFAIAHKLEYIVDSAGNIIIKKPATKGMEDRETIILQAHVDMVPQKNSDKKHDFLQDSIEMVIDGDWVRANQTTLGADNGIGCAAMFAILAAHDIPHGPIEALFTVDEEVGMGGAKALKPALLKGRIMLNTDCEGINEIYIGCAGGLNTDMELAYKEEVTPKDSIAFEIHVKGLKGGHSGVDIHLGRGNAIKILNRILWEVSHKHGYRLAKIEGGTEQHNVIPREAYAIGVISAQNKGAFLQCVERMTAMIKSEYIRTDDGLKIAITELAEVPTQVMDMSTARDLLDVLYALPNGVMDMSPDISGLVQTSTNLARVKSENSKIIVYTMQRGSVDSLKDDVANMVYSALELTGGVVKFAEPYPGWNPNVNSRILSIAKKIFERVFGKEPAVKAIHAGLECGLIGAIYPGLDTISFGPTIINAHSPDERVEIATVEKFWDCIIGILKDIPKAK